jgi:hypothetical protein
MIDPAVLLALAVQLGFLLVVLNICWPAFDFVKERLKRIKRKRQYYADQLGWRVLFIIILILLMEYWF